MKALLFKAIFTVLPVFLFFSCSKITTPGSIEVGHLMVEYLENPLGIDETRPRLSWQMSAKGRNKSQSAFQIKVADSEEDLEGDVNLLWDSGKSVSKQNAHVRYAGTPLKSGQGCYFKIRVWDENDIASEWSSKGLWTMGLLDKNDWHAKWIGFKTMDRDKKDTLHLPASPYLRKTFKVKQDIKKATLYVTSLGVFEMSLNGKRIGSDLLAPGWTDYNKRVYYKTYDVGEYLSEGANTLGGILGDGWYAGYVGPKVLSKPRNRELYGLHPALLSQLEVEYEDGQKVIIISDESWKGNEGPLVYADLLMGAGYNANLELPGWDTSNYDDRDWASVFIHEGTQGEVQAYPGNSIQVYNELEPIEISEPKKNTYIFNLGQNFAGHARLKVSGKRMIP